ncbi:trypsin-like peptidase domain-containing protein [Actinomadura mexicana]|uniref:Trypsin-like peptidase domain-containing protein n=1 Tax=Actinomadura mexicana TaxID=134959 RepID=A0A239FE01_9ACTN|nr:trypsin-like peptidase domain-containing protein [Actinomadura mexicana]SNS55057.1 Trypsin-like peptidase domain-containing protein [Actinomadura mexicana]
MIPDEPRWRTVEVLVEEGEQGYGTGYRISAGLVLTCRHVLAASGAVTVRLVTPDESVSVAAERVWTAEGPEVDLALLRVADGSLPPVAPAVLADVDPWSTGRARFVSWGFPASHDRESEFGGVRDVDQVDGDVLLGANVKTGLLDLHRDDAPQRAGRRYRGLSGGPVLVGGKLVGVVRRAEPDGPLTASRVFSAAGPHRPRIAGEFVEPQPSRERLNALLDGAGVRLDPGNAGPSAPLRRSRYWSTITKLRARCPDPADRDAELGRLQEFATGGAPYLWLVGEPWAGKTTLAAAFAGDPAPDVITVAFFVSRSAGSRLADFRAALADQLAPLVGETPTPGVVPAAFDLDDLWQRAVERVTADGRHLMLIVDGLDEDDHLRHRESSIAAQLPEYVPPGSHVLVTSRHFPEVPADVPDGHPLRGCERRTLPANEASRASRNAAERDLQQHLRDRTSREVLGLLAASGGGLADEDIARLTGLDLYDVRELVEQTVARLVERREDGGRDRYSFAHDLIRETTTERLGAETMAGFWARVLDWAETHRTGGWPAGTPLYLLDRFPQVLADNGDLDRLLRLNEPDRWRRLLERTGTVEPAVLTLTDSIRLLLAADSPDLAVIYLLALWRDQLRLPVRVHPEVIAVAWTELGELERAERMAREIPVASIKANILISMAEAANRAGAETEAALWLQEAELLAGGILSGVRRARTLARIALALGPGFTRAETLLAEATRLFTSVVPSRFRRRELMTGMACDAARAGLCDSVERIARSFADRKHQWPIIMAAARAAAEQGLQEDAERLAGLLTPDDLRWETFAELVRLLADRGEFAAAEELARTSVNGAPAISRALGGILRARALRGERAEAQAVLATAIGTVTAKGGASRQAALGELLTSVVDAGLLDEAERLMSLLEGHRRVLAAARAAVGALDAGLPDTAIRLMTTAAGLVSLQPRRQWAPLVEAAPAVAAGGDLDSARGLLTLALTVAGGTSPRAARAVNLLIKSHVAELQGASGVLEAGIEAALRLPSQQDLPAETARAATELGLTGPAVRAAVLVVDVHERNTLLGTIAERAARDGRLEVVHRALAGMSRTRKQLFASVNAAGELAKAGRTGDAEQLVDRVRNGFRRATGLARLARIVGARGERDQAVSYLLAAEQLAPAGSVRHLTQFEITAAAVAAARRGRYGEAERIAAVIDGPRRQVSALAELAETAYGAGSYAHVARFLTAAEELLGELEADSRDAVATELAAAAARVTDLDTARRLVALVSDPAMGLSALTEVARAARGFGNAAAAGRLLAEGEKRLAGFDADSSEGVATELAAAAVEIGDLDLAERLATGLADPRLRVEVLLAVCRASAERLRALRRRVAREARGVRNLRIRGELIGSLAAAVAATGNANLAGRTMDDAETAVRTIAITNPEPRCRGLVELALLSETIGDAERARRLLREAEQLAATYVDEQRHQRALAHIAHAAAQLGLLDEAERVTENMRASRLPFPAWNTLAAVAERAAALGDTGRAFRLIEESLRIARSVRDPKVRGATFAGIAAAALRAGLPEQAQSIIGEEPQHHHRQGPILRDIALATAAAGRLPDAERMAAQIRSPARRREAFEGVIARLVEDGDSAEAERLIVQGIREDGWLPPPAVMMAALPEVVPPLGNVLPRMAAFEEAARAERA